MRLRVPPGRAGRQWLRHRVEVARRAADLLDHKRRELESEMRRLRTLVRDSRSEWEESLIRASEWLDRIDATGGPRSIRLAAGLLERHAEAPVKWRSVMGVEYPIEIEGILPDRIEVVGLEGGAALALASEAYRRATEVGIRVAATEAAHNRIAAELERTVRRLRALELQAIPAHEQALASLELRLEEDEREDLLRSRWATAVDAAVTRGGES
jgi:V/A-type H+-transporting ATPase subunit D